MNICVYTIMRDEIDNVLPWAETTCDADVRFVLDTGSTDGTFDALVAAGVRVARGTFDPFRFDDARNASLALAPTADLYFRLDADEQLPADWREQVEAVYDPRVPRYRYRVRNVDGIWQTITRDDLHQRPYFRWKYPTHEVLTGPPVAMDMPRLTVTHTHQGRRPHHVSNLSTLATALFEYPGDHRMAFYFARELWYAGQWVDCRTGMMNFLALPNGWDAERAEAWRILAAIDDDPERWLWKAVGECPARREPWVDLARLYLGGGEPERARTMLDEALRRTDESLYTTDPRAWYDGFDELADEIDHALGATTR